MAKIARFCEKNQRKQKENPKENQRKQKRTKEKVTQDDKL